jgi:hypothetical protein
VSNGVPITTNRESVFPVAEGAVVAIKVPAAVYSGRNFRPRLPKRHLSCVDSLHYKFGNVIDCSVYGSARKHNRKGWSDVTSATYNYRIETHLASED